MSNILLANITWNRSGWKNLYVNPKAGHSYARRYPGHESMNFNFNKKGVDTPAKVKGYIHWNNAPVQYEQGGLIIFYTFNTDFRKGQIVGMYGNAHILKEYEHYPVKGFRRNRLGINVHADKKFSLLFPVPLDAAGFKPRGMKRLIGQNGFRYMDENFAEKVLRRELLEMQKSGIAGSDFAKLKSVYTLYTHSRFDEDIWDNDEKEQQELELLYGEENISKIREELKNLDPKDPEIVYIRRKAYKRDNKTVAQLKILRNHTCQLCGKTIVTKSGKKYIEAAHISAKHLKGSETPDNILILCPNHHKEFDFGELSIRKHTKDVIHFSLNKVRYSISLKI